MAAPALVGLEKGEKPHERVAREAVLHHVRALGYDATAQFVGGDSEPPDYLLTLDGVRYALEATMVMDSVPLGADEVISRAGMDAGLAHLVARIKNAAIAEGLLNGYVYLSPPARFIRDLNARLSTIVPGVLAVLREGQVATGMHHGRVVVDGYGAEVLDVYYLPNGKPDAEIACGEAEYVGAARATLRCLIANCIDTKRVLLAKVTEPKILALVHGYPLVEHSDYALAFAGIEADDFAAIVVVVAYDRLIPLAWRLTIPLTSTVNSA